MELIYDQNQKDVLEYARNILKHGLPAGILMIVCGILFDGDLAFAATMVVFAAWALISIIGSYFACKDIDA